MQEAVISFFKRSAELLTGVVAVVAMVILNIFLQQEFQAGSFDLVVLLRPFYFLYELFVIHAGMWLLWKIVYPGMAKFLDVDIKEMFKTDRLTVWQKVLVVVVLWCAYLLFMGCIVFGGVMS